MEGFTVVDAIVAAVIILSALLAYSRGLVREALDASRRRCRRPQCGPPRHHYLPPRFLEEPFPGF